jgi:glutamyl-tRNA synthetase
MSVRTRFAPSPTGFLHVGSARTALYAWLFARRHSGQFILRIEDTDKEREVEGAIGHVMESLRWLGITWDEGVDVDGPYAPYIQSQRLPLYRKYAEQLLAAGFAYPDPYTEEEVAAFRAQAENEKRPFLFRDYRPEVAGEWDGSRPLRFRTPRIARYEWHDAVLGNLSAGEEALDDFILIKSDGYPTYNFAHVVDDIEMKITHVMRGQEFVSSTPKFLALYEALDTAPPVFATLPPILGESGTKKLSKRDGAKDVLDYKREGYLPEALVNFLALLGWNPGGDEEFFTPDQLIASFALDRVQRSGAQFNEEKLLHLNREWMRTLTDDGYLAQLGDDGDIHILARALPILKERAQTFGEARTMLETELDFLFTPPTPEIALLTAKEPSERPGCTKEMLSLVLATLKTESDQSTAEAVKELLMPIADLEEAKGKGGRGAMLWPLRYALSGKERSPDPFTLVAVLGTEESISRVEHALAIL